MDTVIKKIMHDDSDDEIYEQAAEILKNGGLVAFPTETLSFHVALKSLPSTNV